jgi:hypothetical protein
MGNGYQHHSDVNEGNRDGDIERVVDVPDKAVERMFEEMGQVPDLVIVGKLGEERLFPCTLDNPDIIVLFENLGLHVPLGLLGFD